MGKTAIYWRKSIVSFLLVFIKERVNRHVYIIKGHIVIIWFLFVLLHSINAWLLSSLPFVIALHSNSTVLCSRIILDTCWFCCQSTLNCLIVTLNSLHSSDVYWWLVWQSMIERSSSEYWISMVKLDKNITFINSYNNLEINYKM